MVLDVFNGVAVPNPPVNVPVASPAELWSRMLRNLLNLEMSALPSESGGEMDPGRVAKAALWSCQLVFLRDFSQEEPSPPSNDEPDGAAAAS